MFPRSNIWENICSSHVDFGELVISKEQHKGVGGGGGQNHHDRCLLLKWYKKGGYFY
jgi:hypothetical protein